ncbi:uncharacterized protein QC761_0007280 [Podospora bellae-mahoneyi]|uniref:Uncharacterized protein n=1 Tax=Podospora bellae-mahoneyi TaxID=2093777 RepID=A0ABR0FX48_9PEZI|nr:hypothetical protein QC761_0007280 [Podospora bellae-mahoneyi]
MSLARAMFHLLEAQQVKKLAEADMEAQIRKRYMAVMRVSRDKDQMEIDAVNSMWD